MLLPPIAMVYMIFREIDLENTLMDLIKNQSNPTIALLIKKGYIEVRITAKADTLEAAIRFSINIGMLSFEND